MFQSHLGSILPREPVEDRQSAIVVSIPPWFDFAPFPVSAPAVLPRFNPTLVRFCPCSNCLPTANTTCFNPTLVRFCHARGFVATRQRVQFQSHLGSILPKLALQPPQLHHLFQSHLGSILPWRMSRCLKPLASFNPTLVRFCPRAGTDRSYIYLGFNPTLVRFCLRDAPEVDNYYAVFQSHLGSILPGESMP